MQKISVWQRIKQVLTNQRGEVNLDGFWPSTSPSPAGAPEQPGGPPSPPPAAPPPTDELSQLRNELSFLRGAVMSRQQPAAPTPTVPAKEEPLLPEWTDGEFLTEAETHMLLNADPKNMREMFNRMLNNVGKTVDGKYREVVGKLKADLDQTGRRTQEEIERDRQARTQHEFRSQFVTAHPDLAGPENEWIVGQAAQRIAQQAQAQPWAYNGGPQQIFTAIAETARQLKQELLQRWGGGGQQQTPTSQQTPTPAGQRRFFVESNNSSRAGNPQQNADPQARGVAELIDFRMRGGR